MDMEVTLYLFCYFWQYFCCIVCPSTVYKDPLVLVGAILSSALCYSFLNDKLIYHSFSLHWDPVEMLLQCLGILIVIIGHVIHFTVGLQSTFPRKSKTSKKILFASKSHNNSTSNIVLAFDALESPTKARQYRLRREEQQKQKHQGTTESASKSSKSRVFSHFKKNQVSIDRDAPYDRIIVGLEAYRASHGDLVMPRRWVIPHDDESYPPDLRGIDLPGTVYSMQWWQRHVKERPERVTQLTELGFVWQRMQPEWNLVMEALITYINIYGDLLVPNGFVVPHGDSRWPAATWKIPLGNCIYRIRSRHDFLRGSNALKRRDQLNGLGFVWDVSEHKFRVFCSALTEYARLETKLRREDSSGRTLPLDIPTSFIVPLTVDWPEELWGYPLGAKCSAVRQKELYVKGRPDRKQTLAEIGFHWNGNSDMAWLKVVHAAAIYSKLHGRNMDVPSHYVVPEPPGGSTAGDDWPWPESLWGLKLGQRLKDIRLKGAYLYGDGAEERKRQLDALGFVWKPKRGRKRT